MISSFCLFFLELVLICEAQTYTKEDECRHTLQKFKNPTPCTDSKDCTSSYVCLEKQLQYSKGCCIEAHSYTTYLMEDNLPVKSRSGKMRCEQNSDCLSNDYCEIVQNQEYTFNNTKMCFRQPRTRGKHYEIANTDTGLPVCSQDTDCPPLSFCKLDFGVFQIRIEETTRIVTGICVQASRYSATIKNSQLQLPVVKNGHYMNCTKNRDCSLGMYCEIAFNPSEKLKKERYCYGAFHGYTGAHLILKISEIPIDEQGLYIQTKLNGLPLCSNSSDCPGFSFCLRNGDEFVNQGKRYNGVCVEALCKYFTREENRPDSLCNEEKYCRDKKSFVAIKNRKKKKSPLKCVMNNRDNTPTCCHDFDECSNRKVSKSNIKCTKHTDCPEFGLCDKCGFCYNGSVRRDEMTCEDRATRVFNEEPCVGSDLSDVTSGKCIANHVAVCLYGHCCPRAKLTSNNEYIMGKYSYRTNEPCNASDLVKPPFRFAICENANVVLLGKNVITEEFSAYPKCPNCLVGEVCVSDGKTFRCVGPKFCPDQATPFNNQPNCFDPKTNSSCNVTDCYYNRCCPSLLKIGDTYHLGKRTFVTEVPCVISELVKEPFQFAYCYKGKIVVFGKDVIQDDIDTYKICDRDQDCASNGTQYCVSMIDNYRCLPAVFDSNAYSGEHESWQQVPLHVLLKRQDEEFRKLQEARKKESENGFDVVTCTILGLFALYLGICATLKWRENRTKAVEEQERVETVVVQQQ